MKKSISVIVAVVTTLLISSCNYITKSINDTLYGKPKNNGEPVAYSGSTGNFLTDPEALAKAEKSLVNLPDFKGKTVNIYDDIHFYDDGRIMAKIEDPDTLQNINEYDYSSDGEWSAKKPVSVSTNDINNMKTKVILLDSIHFTTVAKIAAIYADSTKAVQGTTNIDHVYYIPEVKQWYCSEIKSPRSSYEIYFHTNGAVKEFRKE